MEEKESKKIIEDTNLKKEKAPRKTKSTTVQEEISIKDKKNNRNDHSWTILLSIISLFIGAGLMYLLIYFVLPIDNTSTVINKSQKEVTVNENGIADAVEKLYDAVVVVKVYKDVTPYSSGTGFVYKRPESYYKRSHYRSDTCAQHVSVSAEESR